jgi:hypothetical protein
MMKQSYFEMKYKFTKPFHLLVKELGNMEINYIIIIIYII